MIPVPGWPEGVSLGEPVDLGGSSRSQVHRRQVLQGPSSWGTSVVVKRFLPQPAGSRAAMGWEREVSGLAYLPNAPQLLATDHDSQSLVMEDLGEHPTLADALLGADAGAAWRHTVDWAAALGACVVADPEVREQARVSLGSVVSMQDRQVRTEYPRAGLSRLAEIAGIRSATAATAQALDLVDWLEHDVDRHVLGPGDNCPDNAILTPSGVRLIDLEGAGLRHVAYEAAYAAEPFSTCWCVFTPPTGLTSAMLDAFTTNAAVPGLDEPNWPQQVRAAVVLWVLSGSLWLLDGAVSDRMMAPSGRIGPAFRALLLSRWRWVVRECSEEFPDIAAACAEAITWAVRNWGSSALELPGYPAFASDLFAH